MPQRKNPTPQRVPPAEGQKESNGAEINIEKLCQDLQLKDNPEKLREVLQKVPRDSLYRENEVDDMTVSASDKNKDGKFVCKKCSKMYTTASGLRYHLQNICSKWNRDKYTCLVCQMNFTKKENVVDHVSTTHLEDENSKESRRSRRKVTHSYKSEDVPEDCYSRDAEFIPEGEESEGWEEDDEVDIEKVSTPKRSFKKPRMSVGTPPSSSLSTFASLDRPFEETMTWFFDFLQKFEADYPVSYPTFQSNFADLKQDAEFKKTDFKRSPIFEIVRENEKGLSVKNPGIDPFCALKTTKNSNDLIFNAGGPVWAISWCPASLKDHGSAQYLAISTHSGLHSADSCYNESGLIQIWDCGVLKLHAYQGESPKFAFGISLNEAPVWDMKWCRVGGKILSDRGSRLGILTAACGSGKVLVLAIPEPESRPSGEIYKAKPEIVLIPAYGDKRTTESHFGQCLCVDWTLSDGGQWLAGGYAKGSVALWKLKEPSDILMSENSELVACRTFHAHSKAVRSLCWCPYDEHILATGGGDRILKLWNRSYTEAPIMVSKTKISIPLELTWPALWCGFFVATDEVFAGPLWHGLLYFDILSQMSTPYIVVPFKSACWSVSHSDWMNCVVGGDATGLTVVHACSNMSRKRRSSKVIPKVRLFSTDVQWDLDKDKGSPEGRDVKDFGLIFHDTNFKSLAKIEKRDSFKKVRLQDTYPATVCDRPSVQSVNRTSWNPNFGSHTWIASGMHCGLVRLHCVDMMHCSSMDQIFETLSKKS